MSNHTSDTGRRRFIKLSLAGLAAAPLSNLLFSESVSAQDAPKVDVNDPTAVQLGYVHDSTQVDASKYPQHTAEQFCHNCQLYTGQTGEEWGPCAIFGGKLVNANGWCSAWVPKTS